MQQTVLCGITVRSTAGLDLVGCATACTDRDQLLASLGRWLTERGYTQDQYPARLLAREAEFPTGLETPDGGVALVHTDASLVTRPALVACRPDQPIAFRRMDQPDAGVDVRLIILLALKSGSEHLDILRRVATLLSDEALRTPLLTAPNSPEDILHALSSALDDATTAAP